MFVRNIKTFNFKLLLEYESSIHNIAFNIEKVVLSESGEKYAQITHCLQANKSSKHINLIHILVWEDNRTCTFHWMKR